LHDAPQGSILGETEEDQMSFAPYLAFPGTAREAMTHYAKVFGAGDLQIMTFADAPPGSAPPGNETKVMHSQFSAGPGAPLMGADMPDGQGGWVAASKNAHVFHAAKDEPAARRIFDALAEGGTVIMALGPVFWSPAFGMLTDRFGISWMITVAPQA
jgi:PhnB protein